MSVRGEVMPTIEENKKCWDGDYSWHDRGEEWSKDWGSVTMQWYGTILPRIHSFLPARTIVEIGCGYGRWTEYLKNYCSCLIAVDLSDECIDACRQRFVDFPHVSCHCNNGNSLEMVGDASVDFVFSFDTFPLVDGPTLDVYLSQLQRILDNHAAVFIHHSNLGAYPFHERLRKISRLGRLLQYLGVVEKDVYWRDDGVSADLMVKLAERHGLKCISQELIRWGTKRIFIDAISIIVKDKRGGEDCQRYKNICFDFETQNLSRLAQIYGRPKKVSR